MPKTQSTCNCGEYPFPHRENSGKCKGEEEYEIELEGARTESWKLWKEWQKERKVVIEEWS